MTDAPPVGPAGPAESLATGRPGWIVLLLAIVGGSVDAAVLLRFGVLTAAQTGNTTLLALALARGHLAAGLSSAVSVLGYVLGAAVGEALIVARRDSASRLPGVDRALLAEVLPLGALLVGWFLVGPTPSPAATDLLVACAALAMGIQGAAVLYLHAGPATTYVTGTLTTFTVEAIRRLLRRGTTPVPGRPAAGAARASSASPGLYGGTWLAYLVGALIGASLFLRVGAVAVALPLAVLLAVIAALPRRS